MLEHVECPIQELRALRAKLREGGSITIGIKNEGVELWRQWKPANKDNHLWTWNSMLLGNTLRAAGFLVDHISTTASKERTEAFILLNKFGRKAHTFQYIWAHGHKPAKGESWPQTTNAHLVVPGRSRLTNAAKATRSH